jgi:O-antigen/teichoic acid export membrane protein
VILRLKAFIKSDFVVSSFYSGISTLIRIATAFIMSKILAIYLGPSGMGLIGQLSNFVTIALALAGGLINNGVVKYVAEYKAVSPSKLPLLIGTSFRFVVVSGLLVGAGLLIFARFISGQIFLSNDYRFVFILFGLSIVFYSLNNFLQAIVNGFKEFRLFNLINISSSLFSLLISFWLIYRLQTKGALISLVINQSVCILITLVFLKNKEWLSRHFFTARLHLPILKNLSRFILMALVSTACVPVAQMYVRSFIIRHFSLADAGLWEAVNRISTIYLMFFVTTLTTYYLPRLSEINNQKALKEEIVKVYKIVLPVVCLSSFLIYLFRNYIISLLFTSEFQLAHQLFLFQTIGDVLKIAAWLLAFQMVAKAMTSAFIITEIVFSASFIFLSVQGLTYFGLVGVTYAYALNYLLYLVTLVIMFRKLLFTKHA